MIPNKIIVPSDGNELEYRMKLRDKGEDIFIYEYVKSITKKGMRLRITETQLEKELKNGTFKEN